MTRSLTTRNFFEKRLQEPIVFENDVFRTAIGEKAVISGLWQIYGIDKNGKTTFALMMAKDFSFNYKVWFISAEQGLKESFKLACERTGINNATKILWDEYIELKDLVTELKKPKSPQIIFIDNTTIYSDEIKGDLQVKYLAKMFPKKLLIMVSHEDRNEPSPACAKMIKKLSEVFFRVKGLKVFVTSRYTIADGSIVINDEMSEMYWG